MKYLIFIVVAVLLQALTYGYISARYSSAEILQFTFTAFLLCGIVYSVRVLTLKSRPLPGHKKLFLYLNVYTAIAFVLVTVQGGWNWQFDYLLTSSLLAFIGVVLPLYWLQCGMQKSEPMLTMLALALVPSVTYVFEWYFGGEFNWWAFLLICAAVVVSIGYMIFQTRSSRDAVNGETNRSRGHG